MLPWCVAALLLVVLAGCGSRHPAPHTVTMVIESSPTSLDPRVGVDAQSEHIFSLIFDSLVHKNASFNVEPWLATSWETPDPLTYRFHLRNGVRFHNGQPLTSKDVKYTLDSTRDGTVITAKAASLAHIASIETPDAATVVIHMKQPDAALLWNLCDGASGIIPAGSGRDFAFHPIGSGPFKFVSQMQDDEVVLERNDDAWQVRPGIARIRFAVVPDAITRALELEKGSADVCINCMTADMVQALSKRPNLQVESGPGTIINYITFNAQDSILREVRGSSGDCAGHESAADYPVPLERPRAAGGKFTAHRALGMDGRRGDVSIRPSQGECPARCGRLEARQGWSAVSVWR